MKNLSRARIIHAMESVGQVNKGVLDSSVSSPKVEGASLSPISSSFEMLELLALWVFFPYSRILFQLRLMSPSGNTL